MNTPDKRVEEIANRIVTELDGRTVTSHEHYRTMLASQLEYELTQYHQDLMSELHKKYWLNPKRSKSDIAKDNAWNDLGNTLRRGV